MFSYRSLLKPALAIAWKHKYLWFLGLFASLAATSGSWEYQILVKNLNQGLVDGSYFQLNNIFALGELVKGFCQGFANLFSYDLVTILNALTLLLITIIILIIFIWLAIVCQAALVNNAKKILALKKPLTTPSLRFSLTESHRHFWSVLGLNFLIKILISAAFFVVSLPLLLMVISDANILMVFYVILFVIFIPVATSLSLMLKYSIAYNVLDKASFIGSIEKGWRLFKKNWLVSLEMAIILFVINFVISGVLLLLMSLFLLPLLLLGLMFNIISLIVVIMLIMLILIILVGSFLTTFQITTWTNLFLRLKEKGGLAKLERIFKRQK